MAGLIEKSITDLSQMHSIHHSFSVPIFSSPNLLCSTVQYTVSEDRSIEVHTDYGPLSDEEKEYLKDPVKFADEHPKEALRFHLKRKVRLLCQRYKIFRTPPTPSPLCVCAPYA